MTSSIVTFLSGTRKIERIPLEVKEVIAAKISQGHSFIVGDAPGSDRAFQRHLAELNVALVTVFSSLPNARNNLGNWNLNYVSSGLKTKSNAMHAAKDRRMAMQCDDAIMIWDGQSAGTLANLIDVIEQSKPSLVFNYLDHELIRFDNIESLMKYLEPYSDVKEIALKRIKRDRKKIQRQETQLKDQSITLF
jgi:hypothetical protein